jgi:transglutaminase-like putative cysteine protease
VVGRVWRWALLSSLVSCCCWLALPTTAQGQTQAHTQAQAQAQGAVRWVPKPQWVDDVAVDFAPPTDRDAMRDGRYTLLLDTRVRLAKSGVERYFRRIDFAVNQTGVETLGEVQIEFAAQYQRLLLHRAAVIRAGQIIDQTKSASLRMLDQERDSADRVYSGTTTALLVLSDVRPGDAVEVSYTVSGVNPILGGRYTGHVRLGTDAPARRVHVEVISSKERSALHWRARGAAPAPREIPINGQQALTWDLQDVQPRPHEDRIPSDFAAPAELELSEFADWNEVAKWAIGLYPPASDATLTAKANELRASSADLETAVLRAIRFVQDDVRYLSISLGQYSIKPHPPRAIFAQRFGDCKDKSYLLVELLRALGVEAHVALADTELRGHLRESLPSPYAFDHVITVIELNGKRQYVDATWSFQGGTLDTLAALDLGAVLIVAPTTSDLSEVPLPALASPGITTLSDYQVSNSGSATLTVKTTFLGERADAQRARLAAKSEADYSHELLNFYEKAFPGVALGKALRIQDDRDADVFTVLETYAIPEFWRSEERSLLPDEIWDYLLAPGSQRRETPLYVANRVWIREVQQITLPFYPEREAGEQIFDDPAARVTRSVSYDDHVVTATHEYRSFAEFVPLSGLTHHLQFLTNARKQVGLELQKKEPDPDSRAEDAIPSKNAHLAEEKNWWPITLSVIGVVSAVAMLYRFATRRARRRRLQWLRDGTRGELPENPQPAHSLSDALDDFTQQACSCGAGLPRDMIEITELSFQARALHAARAECPACGTRRRAYFELSAPERD